jgi:hypothetical protein
MASSGNFCTWNPLAQGNKSDIAFSSGNCAVTSGSGQFKSLSNFVIPTNSGKWYVEVCLTSNSGNTSYVGIVSEKSPDLNATGDGFNFGRSSGDKTVYIDTSDGRVYTEGTENQDLASFNSNNDIIAMVLDMDNDTVQFYGNGSSIGSAQAFPDVGDNYYIWCGGNNDKVCHINAGQDSTFGGAITAGGNTDGNYGDFKYSVPTDAKAITTANLPISDDIDPAQTDDDYPQKNFNVVTYTGNGSTINVTGAGFQPDFVWIKGRSVGYDNMLFDTNRGTNKILKSNSSAAEITTVSTALTSFDSDGFTYGSEASGNQSSATYVAWCWRANGGTTTTDTSGDISTVRQSNTASGFAILTWSGNGSNNQRLPHGLGKKPGLVIAKRRDASQSWGVWTQHLGANSKELQLNSSSGWQASSNAWYESGMTTDFVGIGSDRNISSSTNVAYVWTEIEGYSKFGLFEGNSNADGPFVYTGFRPRLVFCKAIDASENWQVRDTARSTFNANSQVRIYWNATSAESSASTASPIDFLSNGFKVRGSNSEINTNTIIFGAWGDVPFKYNNTF